MITLIDHTVFHKRYTHNALGKSRNIASALFAPTGIKDAKQQATTGASVTSLTRLTCMPPGLIDSYQITEIRQSMNPFNCQSTTCSPFFTSQHWNSDQSTDTTVFF